MKAEDVPDEWISVARQAWFHATGPSVSYDWRATIAAVAPLIAAAEREACAKVAATMPGAGVTMCPYGTDNPGDPTWLHTEADICPVCRKNADESLTQCTASVGGRIAAAIRARSDAP